MSRHTSGYVIAERFELAEPAGAGGMGTVYRAWDRTTQSWAALKLLRNHGRKDVARLQREAAALAALSHPTIVSYRDHGETPQGDLYIAMEWVDGESLGQRLQRAPLSLAESAQLFLHIADALAAAHDCGIVHRDIKPRNIFLCNGDAAQPKLLDFGVAWLDQDHLGLGPADETAGTPGYMAPELARHSLDPSSAPSSLSVDARADVFSLGCVLYECITGRPAFSGRTLSAILAKILAGSLPPPSAIAPGIPAGLDRLVLSMLSAEPHRRPRSARDAMRELLALGALSDRTPQRPNHAASLTDDERRVFSAVLFESEAAEEATHTISDQEITQALEAMRRLSRTSGARLETLADGSTLLTFDQGDNPRDQALVAARCALAVGSVVGGAAAMVTGRGEVRQGWLAGEVIDRVVELLQLPKPECGVRLDPDTQILIADRFEFAHDEHGRLLLRELPRRQAARRVLGQQTMLEGRDAELDALMEAFRLTDQGRGPNLVVVSGPPGIGKSRLRQELLARALQSTPDLLFGEASPLAKGAPFGLLASMLRDAIGFVEADIPAANRERLEAFVATRFPPDDGQKAFFLGQVLGLEPVIPAHESVQSALGDAQLMGDRIRRALEGFVASFGSDRAALVVLEDAQWGDGPSFGVLERALRREAPARSMVLVLTRSRAIEGLSTLIESVRSHVIELRPLDPASCRRLIYSVVGPELVPSWMDRIAEASGGNPFYLEELLRGVREGVTKLPDTVSMMVQSRLSELTEPQRKVLRGASVFSHPFTTEALDALTGLPSDEVQNAVRHLVALELFQRPPGHDAELLAFGHELYREAAADSLTERDRVLGHAIAADWLERRGERDALRLATHFDEGRVPERALHYYVRAAEEAFEARDDEAVLRRIEAAKRVGTTGAATGAERTTRLGRLALLEARASLRLGKPERAAEAAEHALSHVVAGTAPYWEAIGEHLAARAALGQRERFDEVAIRLADPVIPPDVDDPVAYRAYLVSVSRAIVDLLACDREELAQRLVWILQAAGRGEDHRIEAWIRFGLGTHHDWGNDLHRGREQMHAAASCFAKSQDAPMQHAALARLSRLTMGLGDLERAIEIAERADEIARAIDDSQGSAEMRSWLGELERMRGRAIESLEHLHQAVKAFEHRHDTSGLARSLSRLARSLLANDDAAAARAHATRAVELIAAMDHASPDVASEALSARADVLCAMGESSEALGDAQLAVMYSNAGRPRHLTKVRALLAQAGAQRAAANGHFADTLGRARHAAHELIRTARPEEPETFIESFPELRRLQEMLRAEGLSLQEDPPIP